MVLLRSDLSQRERTPKAFRGGLMIRQLLLQRADDRMEKMMRLDQLAPGHRFDGVESCVRAVHVRHGDRAVQGDNR